VPGLIPVATALLAWAARGERPPHRAQIGLAVAFAGLVLVASPTGRVGSDRLLGDALFVGAAISWSIYTLVGRRAIARYGSISANVYATAAGTLLLLPVTFLDGGWSPLVHAPAGAIAGIAYLSVIGTVLGFVAFYEGVRLIGAARAASFALLVPIFGVLSSVLALHEPLRATLALGGAIVICGLWLAESRRDYDRALVTKEEA
jgi:drug/metabolite transporter (DMT)-like permease